MAVLDLRVSPGARRTRLLGRQGDGWELAVAVPDQGADANAALVAFLSDLLDLPLDCIEIQAGELERDKHVFVSGHEQTEVDERLLRLLGVLPKSSDPDHV